MKITNAYTSSYKTVPSPAFGWSKVCSGKIINHIQNGTTREIPVDICLLKDEDKQFIQSVFKKWKGKTTYADNLLQRFYYKHKAPATAKEPLNYFMLIPQKQNNGKGQATPLCFAEIRGVEDEFELCYLQASPSIINKNKLATEERLEAESVVYGKLNFVTESESPKVSGTGQMLLYGIVRYIKSMGGKSLDIDSRNDGFYEKIFHSKKNFYKHYSINRETLSQFLEETRQKYGLPNEPDELPQEIIEEINKNKYC